MAKNLSQDEITKLFQYNITDINELDEGNNINILINIIIIIQESYPIGNDLLGEDEEYIENILIMLNERNIEAEIERENLRIVYEQVRIESNWKKVCSFIDNL